MIHMFRAMIHEDTLGVVALYSDYDTVCSLTEIVTTRLKTRWLDIVFKRDYNLEASQIPESICFAPYVATVLTDHRVKLPWRHLLEISNPLIRKTKTFCAIVDSLVKIKIFQTIPLDAYSNVDNLTALTRAVAAMVLLCPAFHLSLTHKSLAPPCIKANMD
eukprot:TRINITY_DN2416_c0_g1_i1.p1 TRINITY_DN2416_c0_g1~~TRINITY_DN2416_c0_g1_i1.p1  ORF type:complete len:161 (-),score=19.29 TRINITY_DN2416_c0_g1_i1:327-809(-)